MSIIHRCKVESIKPTGTDGMYVAVLGINDHGAAITVIGKDLTECVERAYIILQTFKKA
jgi:hypothetical protein